MSRTFFCRGLGINDVDIREGKDRYLEIDMKVALKDRLQEIR